MRRCFNPSNHFGQFPPENPLNYRPPSDRTDQFTPQLFCIPSPRAANGTRLVRPSPPPPKRNRARCHPAGCSGRRGGAGASQKCIGCYIFLCVFLRNKLFAWFFFGRARAQRRGWRAPPRDGVGAAEDAPARPACARRRRMRDMHSAFSRWDFFCLLCIVFGLPGGCLGLLPTWGYKLIYF